MLWLIAWLLTWLIAGTPAVAISFNIWGGLLWGAILLAMFGNMVRMYIRGQAVGFTAAKKLFEGRPK